MADTNNKVLFFNGKVYFSCFQSRSGRVFVVWQSPPGNGGFDVVETNGFDESLIPLLDESLSASPEGKLLFAPDSIK